MGCFQAEIFDVECRPFRVRLIFVGDMPVAGLGAVLEHNERELKSFII